MDTKTTRERNCKTGISRYTDFADICIFHSNFDAKTLMKAELENKGGNSKCGTKRNLCLTVAFILVEAESSAKKTEDEYCLRVATMIKAGSQVQLDPYYDLSYIHIPCLCFI